MKKFIIEDDFWNLFPNAKLGIVICRNIDNSINNESHLKEMLLSSEKECLNHLQDSEFSNNAVIKVWREAFQKFKTKKGARSSIEALLKRIYNGNHLGNINPLVDIYNSASLKYALPCGGEDIDTFVGNIKLTQADGNEDFITLGSDKSEPPYEGEIIYKDELGAICRCWNWRESVRTMLTENTKHAFLCIESVDEKRTNTLYEALDYLKENVRSNLGGTCESFVLDVNNKEINLESF